jgi:hypothetical protein
MFPIAGLTSMFVSVVCVIRPLTFLGIHTRQRALIVIAIGSLVALTGCLLPAKETRVASPRTRLDEFVPIYQFNEFHSIRIPAPKERVYRAIKSVTADEILFFRTLIWIRRFGSAGPESVLNPGKDAPLLDVATRTTFILLADEPNQEIVVGALVAAPAGWRPKKTGRPTPEDFKSLHAPGFALAAMNFHIEQGDSDSCVLTTETRVYATDAATRRRFAAYWRIIYPGSALIRHMWLRAIRKRALAPG